MKLPRGFLSSLIKVCSGVSDSASDDDGFVGVGNLLDAFNAELIIRPLLVEGMLASDKSTEKPWKVLVDEETYNYSIGDISSEKKGSALKPRFRNTVAHELAHTLAFRLKEFGVELKTQKGKTQTNKDFVKQIEAETEKLSPALLISYSVISGLLRKPTISNFSNFYKDHGVSRYVLINRLKLLLNYDPESLIAGASKGFMLGIVSGDSLKPWPIFAHFNSGILPSFILNSDSKVLTPISSIIGENHDFLDKGHNDALSIKLSAGTKANPDATTIDVTCSIEQSAGERLFLILAKG